MNMRVAEFLPLDLAHAALHRRYLGVGYLFSNALATITRGYEAASQVLAGGDCSDRSLRRVAAVWWLKERRLRG